MTNNPKKPSNKPSPLPAKPPARKPASGTGRPTQTARPGATASSGLARGTTASSVKKTSAPAAPQKPRNTPSTEDDATIGALMREIKALWHRNPKVVIAFAALPALLVVLCLVLTGALAPKPVDPNSVEYVLRITPEAEPVQVNAQDAVAYFQKQGIGLQGVRPFRFAENGLKANQGVFFTLQGTSQNGVVMTYTDLKAQLVDKDRFPVKSAISVAVVFEGTALPTSTPAPTLAESPLTNVWNMDEVGNALLLTTKDFDPVVRASLVSHLYSITFAPARAGWPTATPSPTVPGTPTTPTPGQ